MMKRIACIYNSGSGSAADKQLIEQRFDDLDIKLDFLDVKLGEQAIADKIKGESYTGVVAAGGDGTVRFTAELAVQARLPLGILPLGTLNHFAKDLGLPLDLAGAAKVIADGATTQTDYCVVNDHIFLNNASIGLYPSTVIGRERTEKQWGKWLSATKASIGAIRSNKNLACSIATPEDEWDCHSPMIFIGNNDYRVDKSVLRGRDKLNGGRMFLFVVRATRRRKLLLLAILGIFGIHLRGTNYIKSTKGPLNINSSNDSVSIALDGEVFKMHFPLKFQMHAGQLGVLVKSNRPK